MFNRFSFALGDYTSSEKVELSRIIANGEGTVSFIINKKTTHLICQEIEFKRETMKVLNAKKFGLMIVSQTFLRNSAKVGRKLFEWDYLYEKPVIDDAVDFVKTSLQRGLTEISGICNGAGYPTRDLPIVSLLQPGIDFDKLTDTILKSVSNGAVNILSVQTEIEAIHKEEELKRKLIEEENLRKIKEEQDAILDSLENKDMNKLSEDVRLLILKRQEERLEKRRRDELETARSQEQALLWKLEYRLDREMEEKLQRELEKKTKKRKRIY